MFPTSSTGSFEHNQTPSEKHSQGQLFFIKLWTNTSLSNGGFSKRVVEATYPGSSFASSREEGLADRKRKNGQRRRLTSLMGFRRLDSLATVSIRRQHIGLNRLPTQNEGARRYSPRMPMQCEAVLAIQTYDGATAPARNSITRRTVILVNLLSV